MGEGNKQFVDQAWRRAVAAMLSRAAGLPGWLGILALALLGAAIALGLARDATGHWWEAQSGRRPLLAARSWHYQLDNIDIDRLAKVDSDLLVTDYARDDGRLPLSREEVRRLKSLPDGRRRIVVAYLSIGEAEAYRYYWQPEWSATSRPSWDAGENCAWPRNHMVRFWQESWKDIMMRAPGSYLERIIEAGFDGAYLDRIDVYEHQEEPGIDLRAEMIAFVSELSATAKRSRPGFLVIAQNAEDLLSDRAYRGVIDGLGKEDLLFGEAATGKRNPPRRVASSLRQLRKLIWDWKPVFAVEYLETQPQVVAARDELRRLGLVPTFQHRSLDGSDPTSSVERKEQVHGTAEWIAAQCKDKKWW